MVYVEGGQSPGHWGPPGVAAKVRCLPSFLWALAQKPQLTSHSHTPPYPLEPSTCL